MGYNPWSNYQRFVMLYGVRRYIPVILLFLAALVTLFAVFSGESYGKLSSLRKGLEVQREKNEKLEAKVHELRQRASRLETDKRELEKAARNELGMARPDDMIFIFDAKPKDKDEKTK